MRRLARPPGCGSGSADDATLGTVLERLAAVHGSRRLVEEAGHGRSATGTRPGGSTSGPAALADADRARRPCRAWPRPTATTSSCSAWPSAGPVASRCPSTRRCAPDEIDHVVADAGADGRAPRRRRVAPAAGPRPPPAAPGRRRRALLHVGHDGQAQGRRAHPPRPARGPHSGALVPALQLRRDEAVVALPVAHIMGFAVLVGLACGGVPAYVLPRFRPDDVLDAIEQRRATMFVGVPAMYRLLLEAGAEQRDLSSVRVWASGADVMPAELADRFRGLGATATLAGRRCRGRRRLLRGLRPGRVGGAVAVKAVVPLARPASCPATASARRCPATG